MINIDGISLSFGLAIGVIIATGILIVANMVDTYRSKRNGDKRG